MSDLDGVIVAFDLDNTLLDPKGTRYDRVTSEFLSRFDPGISGGEALSAYERIRAWGPVFERLGLGNPLHDRGHVVGAAALVLLFAKRGDASAKWESACRRDDFIGLLDDLDGVARRSRRGPPEDRLVAERELRSILATDARVASFRDAITGLTGDSAIADWAGSFGVIDRSQPVDEVLRLLKRLHERGATCVVISQGKSRVQREKLDLLGVAEFFGGRALITQDASRPGGFEALERAVAGRIDSGDRGADLARLLGYRCLLDEWRSKSCSFYGRCLHALCVSPRCPADALRSVSTATPDQWAAKPPRFVMVGDRYEKDVLPVLELLGADAAVTVHLRMGKYNESFDPSHVTADRRAAVTVTDVDSLWAYLLGDLQAGAIPPIPSPPAIAPPDWFDRELIRWGERSELSCVRTIARALGAVAW